MPGTSSLFFQTTFLHDIKNVLNAILVKKVFPKHDICFKLRIQNKTLCVTISDTTLKIVQLENNLTQNKYT